MLPVFYIEPEGGGMPKAEELEDLGISARWPEGVSRKPGPGPDGRKGVIACGGSEEGLRAMKRAIEQPDAVTWEAMASNAWIGFFLDDLPKEHELRRPDTVPGEIVAMGDEHERAGWVVPVLATTEYASASLPKSYRLCEETEELELETKKQYQPLEQLSMRMWRQTMAQKRLTERNIFLPTDGDEAAEISYLQELESEMSGEAFFSNAERYKLAIDTLAINYRVGKEEVGFMQLLDTETLEEVQAALLGVTKAVRLGKELQQEKERSRLLNSQADREPETIYGT